MGADDVYARDGFTRGVRACSARRFNVRGPRGLTLLSGLIAKRKGHAGGGPPRGGSRRGGMGGSGVGLEPGGGSRASSLVGLGIRVMLRLVAHFWQVGYWTTLACSPLSLQHPPSIVRSGPPKHLLTDIEKGPSEEGGGNVHPCLFVESPRS